MGNLAEDTRLAGRGGRYRAHLSSDWEIWGPNGGYLAVIALRAAGAAACEQFDGLRRLASISIQYLNVADFRDVDLEVTTLRASKRAAALRVTMLQEQRPVLEAMAWIVSDGLDGLRHERVRMPEVPPPDAVPSSEERRRPDDPPPHAFWRNFETREVTWVSRELRTSGKPEWIGWLRFRPTPTFSDPFVDAGRYLLLLDTLSWPAAVRGYVPEELTYMAPSLDFSAQVHTRAPDADWLLCEARAPVAAGGLIGYGTRVWTRDGRLLASGGGQLLCRPLPVGR